MGNHMKFTTKLSSFNSVSEDIKTSIKIHNTLIDSYLEEHILKSDFYELMNGEEHIGSFAIYNHELLTHFYINEAYLKYGEELFNLARKSDHVIRAYVSTGDELFLSHVLDTSRKIENQAYFFRLSEEAFAGVEINRNLCLEVALTHEVEMIKELSGDFFENLPEQVKRGEIFIGRMDDQVVSFGIIEKSKLYESVASTGMFVVENHRQGGLGKSTIGLLIEHLKNQGITPIAGCWYYNHNSKKTLQKAGYYSKSRLLNIHL